MAPSPGPAIVTLPRSLALVTVLLTAVYLAQRVASSTWPSLKWASTTSCCELPTDCVVYCGRTSTRSICGSLSLGPGAPAAIHSDKTRYSSDDGSSRTPPLCGNRPVGLVRIRLRPGLVGTIRRPIACRVRYV